MFNTEVLRVYMVRKLAAQPVWLLAGLLLPLGLVAYSLLSGYEVRGGFAFIMHNAKLLAIWNVAFAWFYLTLYWLGARIGDHSSVDKELPLTGFQLRLHSLLDLGLVPLLACLGSLVAFALILLFTGEPFAHSYYERSIFWVEGGHFDPWALRMLLVSAAVLSGGMLVLAAGVVLERLSPWRALAIALLPGIGALLHVAVRRVEWDFFRFCYKQSSGYDPWLFAAIFGVLLALVAVACMAPRWLRWLAAVVLLGLVAVLGILVMSQSPQSHDPQMIEVSRALGRARFVISWFGGHLHPLLNISLLMESYPSNVSLDNPLNPGGDQWHMPLWVGAFLYPAIVCTVVFLLYVAGGRRRPRSV